MAYKKKPKAKTPTLSKEGKSKKALLERIRERYRVMADADSENRRLAKEDVRFVTEPGAQWDNNMKQERGDRPCLEFNTLRINGKRVINEIRANRPQGKVRAVENGDKEGAELREGLCRNIANMSDFESITDYEAEYQVDAGLGAWRVDTEYSDDSMFDQDIKINALKNPFCLYWDPACKDVLLKRDAEDWLLVDTMSTTAYEAKYKDAEQFDFDNEEDAADWEEEETVRVVEYWYKEPYDKELWRVAFPKADGSVGQDGAPVMENKTVDSTSDEAALIDPRMIVKRRMVHCHRIMMCVASGKAILEGPVEAPGTMFPFVVVHGEVKVIDGKVKWCGLHRYSKDAQQVHNVFMTSATEAVAGAPKAHTWATVAQAEGHLADWAEAHRKNLPVRLFNPDPMQPGAPARHPGADVPVAMMEMVALSAQLVRTTSGLHEASFGEESNEKSGIALARKQNQAQIVTYNFPDNMAKGVKRTWEILLDRIPVVYDAERELRIIGADGAEDYKKVNQIVYDPATGKSIRVNDLSAGKYDVVVTTGPSFSTQSQEIAPMLAEMAGKNPALMQVGGDLFFKAMEMATGLPYLGELGKRMQTILPPPIQKQIAEGKDIPPEAQAVMAQAEQAMAMVQQQSQALQEAAAKVQQDQSKSVQQKAAVDKAIADLKTQEAQFEAKVAKLMADLRVKQADIAVSEAKSASKEQELGFREERVKQTETGIGEIDGIKKGMAELDDLIAQYIQSAAGVMQKMGAKVDAPKPKVKSARIRREGGAMIAETMMDDGTMRRIRAERQNGALVAVPMEETPSVQ